MATFLARRVLPALQRFPTHTPRSLSQFPLLLAPYNHAGVRKLFLAPSVHFRQCSSSTSAPHTHTSTDPRAALSENEANLRKHSGKVGLTRDEVLSLSTRLTELGKVRALNPAETDTLKEWMTGQAHKYVPKLRNHQSRTFVSGTRLLIAQKALDPDFASKLGEKMVPHISKLNAQELATLIYVMFPGLYCKSYALRRAVAKRATSLVERSDVRDVAYLASSWVNARMHDFEFQSAAAEKLAIQAKEITGFMDVCRILSAFAQWQIKSPQHLSPLFARAAELAPTADIGKAAFLLETCVKFGHVDESLVKILAGRVLADAENMRARDLVLSIYGLSKLGHTEASSMYELAKACAPHFDSLDPQLMVQLAMGFERKFVPNDVLGQFATRAVVLAGRGDFSPQQLSAMYKHLARLEAMSPEVLSTFNQEISRCADQMDGFSASDILKTRCMSDFPGSALANDKPVIDTLYQRISKLTPGFDARVTISLLASTSRLSTLAPELAPPAHVVSGLTDRIPRLVHFLTPSEVANTVTSLSVLGADADGNLVDSLVSRMGEVEGSLTSSELVKFVQGLDRMGRINGTVVDLISRTMPSRVRELNCNSLAHVLSAYVNNGGADENAIKAMINHAEKIRGQIPPSDMPLIIQSASDLANDEKIPIESLESLASAFLKTLGLNSYGLHRPIVCFSALAQARYAPGHMPKIAAEWFKYNKASLSPVAVSELLHVLATVNAGTNGEICDASGSMVGTLLSGLEISHVGPPNQTPEAARELALCRALWSAAILVPGNFDAHRGLWEAAQKHLTRPGCGLLVTEGGSKEDESSNLQALLQLHLAGSALFLRFPEFAEQFLKTPEMANVMACATGKWEEFFAQSEARVSGFQLEVREILHEAGFKLADSNIVPPVLYRVDACLPDLQVVVEANGPVRYAATGTKRHMMGSTFLKQRLLNESGWRVASVPWWEWEILETPERKMAYLRRRVEYVSRSRLPPSPKTAGGEAASGSNNGGGMFF
eukprot:comp17711_c1_seq1/m.17612 comp17711_c1_seq1/g.17612  ORF comp17711_c1_seq1/g.17612 comp17711_c1_seq1/m.17612 type:complete len:1006 (-) comp17711_c1_seq1:487-3504(-)